MVEAFPLLNQSVPQGEVECDLVLNPDLLVVFCLTVAERKSMVEKKVETKKRNKPSGRDFDGGK